MLDRHFVESFMKLNGLENHHPEDVIREKFSSASWSHDEIERAMVLIRDRDSDIIAITDDPQIKDLRYTYIKRSSRDLSSLLGVDVVIDPSTVRTIGTNRVGRSRLSDRMLGDLLFNISLFILAISIAVFVGYAVMYLMNIGPFYSPV